MVTVASICLTFYIEVGVSTFSPTPALPKIPSDSNFDSTGLTGRMVLSSYKYVSNGGDAYCIAGYESSGTF
jgi:hypothetical protein